MTETRHYCLKMFLGWLKNLLYCYKNLFFNDFFHENVGFGVELKLEKKTEKN